MQAASEQQVQQEQLQQQPQHQLQQQQKQQQVQRSLLSEYGALLMQHCRQIQQALQDFGPSTQQKCHGGPTEDSAGVGCGRGDIDDDGNGPGDTADRLRSALQVLALHSGYSGRFFDLFRAELRATLSLEAGEQSRLAQHREATRLLKEVCLRSKEMSHDVIKASRELVHAFKAEQRVDDRRRSGSILSRARELAKATIRRRSASRSGGAASGHEPTAQEPAAQEPIVQEAPVRQPSPPSTPLPQPLVDLERSPLARSPRRGRPSEQQQQLKPAGSYRIPAPPRRSSSLNSLPPELQASRPLDPQKSQKQQQQQQQQQQCQPPLHRQPHGGNLSSHFQSTENCLKTVLSVERHQLMRSATAVQPSPSYQPPRPVSASKAKASVCSSVASSAATADLPSDASSLSTDEEEDNKEDNNSDNNRNREQVAETSPPAKNLKKTSRPDKKAFHYSAYATTDMDVRLSELDEDTVTRVTELAEDETGFFNNTSENLSTSAATDWARQLATPEKSLAARLERMKRASVRASAPESAPETAAPAPEMAPPVSEMAVPAPEMAARAPEEAAKAPEPAAPSAMVVVRQRKLPPTAAPSTSAGTATMAAGAVLGSVGIGVGSRTRPHRRRRQMGGRKAPPALSGGGGGGRQFQPHHGRAGAGQSDGGRRQVQSMFSDSSNDSSCCESLDNAPAIEQEVKAVKKSTGATINRAPSTKLLVGGLKETDL